MNPINSTQPSAIPVSTFLQADQNQAAQQPPQSAQAAPVTANKGSWWEKLLPTAGGVLGGIVGIPGDVLGGAGSIAGAAAGGALGQELENKLSGNTGSTKTAAAENALGMGVGSILGKGASMLAGRFVAPLAEKGAAKFIAGQAPGITKELGEYLQDIPLTDLNKAGQVADALTGGYKQDSGAMLNKFVEDTLANEGPQKVQVSDLAMSPLKGPSAGLGELVANETNGLQKFITDNSLGSTDEANAIRSKVSGILNGVPQDALGKTDPISALNAQRDVSKLADDSYSDYINSGRSDATSLKVYKTYQALSNEMKNRLKLNDIPVSDEDKTALANDVQKMVGGIDKNAGKAVADEIRNTDGLTLNGVRNMESNWVQVKNSLQAAVDQASKNFGVNTTDALPVAGSIAGIGGPKSILGTIGGMATKSTAADKTMASLLSGTARTAKGKLIQNVLPLATKAAAVGAANLPNIAEGTPGAAGSPATNPSTQGANINTGTAMNDPLQQVYQVALAGAGVNPNSASILSTIAPLLQKQEQAGAVAGGLLPAFENAGGAQGLGGGLLSRLTALVPGTAANTYQRQQAATASTLAQLLGISPEAALQLTPQLMQSPTTSAIPAGNVNSILGTIGAY